MTDAKKSQVKLAISNAVVWSKPSSLEAFDMKAVPGRPAELPNVPNVSSCHIPVLSLDILLAFLNFRDF